MVWWLLMACAGGGVGDSGEQAAACESVAVAEYTVVDSILTDEEGMYGALLDATGSTLCPGDTVMWIYTYDLDITEVPVPNADLPDGMVLFDMGIPFTEDVTLVLFPEGEDVETWQPCHPSYLWACEHDRLDHLFVSTLEK